MINRNEYKQVWMKQFQFHIDKLAKCHCHIMFLAACITYAIVPKGLSVKIPLTGFPKIMHRPIIEFANNTGIGLTRKIHDLYVSQSHFHSNEANRFQNLLLSFHPDVFSFISNTIENAKLFISSKSNNHFKKFSNLYFKKFNKSFNNFPQTNYSREPINGLTHYQLPPSNNTQMRSVMNVSSPTNPSISTNNSNILNCFNTSRQPVPLQSTFSQLPKVYETKEYLRKDIYSRNQPESPDLNVNHDSKLGNETNVNYINLSNYNLKDNEIDVLKKGLNFSPTPRFDHVQLVADTLKFAKNLRLTYLYKNNNANGSKSHTSKYDESLKDFMNKFKGESDFEPELNADHPIEQFINVILSNISNPDFPNDLPKSNNPTSEEIKAIST